MEDLPHNLTRILVPDTTAHPQRTQWVKAVFGTTRRTYTIKAGGFNVNADLYKHTLLVG